MKEIKLHNGNVSIVDDTNYGFIISKGVWSEVGGRAAHFEGRDKNNKAVITYMHHLVLPPKDGFEVDHKDRNGLHNWIDNLRYLEHWRNIHNRNIQSNNTSGLRGVSWHVGTNRWQIRIAIKGKRVHLGFCSDLVEAGLIYDKAARELVGEAAYQNFPL